jgi:hypothetical protein
VAKAYLPRIVKHMRRSRPGDAPFIHGNMATISILSGGRVVVDDRGMGSSFDEGRQRREIQSSDEWYYTAWSPARVVVLL